MHLEINHLRLNVAKTEPRRGGGEGVFLIMAYTEGYLFQASGIKKGTDFTS